jgi:hypothetical protein
MKNIRTSEKYTGLIVALLFLVATVSAHAQTPAVKNPSPELVSALTKELKVTPEQATGGAGSLFSLAKSRLKPEEFTKVAAAVPGMDGLLKAAPKQENSMMSAATSALPGKSSGLASVTNQFKALGLSPEMVSKFVPLLTKFVGGKAGAQVAELLAGVLK